MKTVAKKNTLIESGSHRGAYEMIQSRAIIQHREHGRLLLVEGFGGANSIEGGTYRWKHGCAYKICETDTLESLYDRGGEWGFCDVDGLSPEEWSGKTIEKIAASVGL